MEICFCTGFFVCTYTARCNTANIATLLLKLSKEIFLLSTFLYLICFSNWIVCLFMYVHASVQVAEGQAKRPPFPYACGLTVGNKRKRTDYHSTITSLHCTTKAHPSIPTVGEREERTVLTTTTTTTNRQ